MVISLIFCLAVVIALLVCILILVRSYGKLKGQYDTLYDSYRNLEELNSHLRADRHDYLNHLQVVYGMMELEEYEELHTYLEPVYKNMMKTGKALKTSNPAINALLRAKLAEAEDRGIDVYVEVKSDLKQLPVEGWELCKVISNLMDNAITALSQKEGEKKINIDITESREQYVFRISNDGPEIPDSMREVIFRQGVTTKSGDGHGMGLYIVENVIKDHNGTIELKSDAAETAFTVSFPKSSGKGGNAWKYR